jgi:MarR family transcriptional regulator, organic hydroperoxide resistance regulator
MRKIRRGGNMIAKIQQLVDRQFGKLLKERGLLELNPPQTRILYTIWNRDEIPISELCKRTQLKKSTLTTMLDRLEQNGFVRRVDDEHDKRTTLIRITARARSIRKSYAKAARDMAEVFYNGFNDREIERFEGYLIRILTNLHEE